MFNNISRCTRMALTIQICCILFTYVIGPIRTFWKKMYKSSSSKYVLTFHFSKWMLNTNMNAKDLVAFGIRVFAAWKTRAAIFLIRGSLGHRSWMIVRFQYFALVFPSSQRSFLISVSVIIRLLQKILKNAKSAAGWHSNPDYSTSTEPILMQYSVLCSLVHFTA